MNEINKNCDLGEGINVLSLCDGMSCGQIALQKANIKVNKYYASEIKEIAKKVALSNYPNTIHIGNVNNIYYKDGVLHTENGDFRDDIDLVIFGSPCQTFSIAMKSEMRIGLENKEKSGLFIQCHRILNEVSPKYFLMENVERMKKDDEDFISMLLGVNPLRINSKLVSAQLRGRLYWTNIPGIIAPETMNVKLQDILECGYTDRDKARALLVSDSRPLTTPVKMFHRYHSTGFTTLIFKSEEHKNACIEYYEKHYKGMKGSDIPDNETTVFDGVRYMSQWELERCQTVPEGYTSCLNRNEAADVLGDGWTIDVIAHILKGLLIDLTFEEGA